MRGWLKPKTGAQYSDVSERTFRDWLKQGLRHSRLPSGSIRIKREWIDAFLESFEESKTNGLDGIVNEVMSGITTKDEL